MSGFYEFSAPMLLFLSVISFIIHFRNQRRKTLIQRPVNVRKNKVKESRVITIPLQSADLGTQTCQHNKLCHFCPVRKLG